MPETSIHPQIIKSQTGICPGVADAVRGENGTVLVQCAISHRHSVANTELAVYPGIVKATTKSLAPMRGGNWNTTPRGTITDFSNRSRKRMLEATAMVRQDWQWFVTLTYPGKFERFGLVKRDLDSLLKAIARQFPNAGALWRMELKPRQSGASEGEIVPHFHILLTGTGENITESSIRRWIKASWSRIVGESVRTQCDKIYSRSMAVSYVAKYAAKPSDYTQPGEWGRHWGQRGELDKTPIITMNITTMEYIELRRYWRKWLKRRKNRFVDRLARIPIYHSCSVFGLGMEPGNYNATILRMISFVTPGFTA